MQCYLRALKFKPTGLKSRDSVIDCWTINNSIKLSVKLSEQICGKDKIKLQ